jgi:hypothetical protein
MDIDGEGPCLSDDRGGAAFSFGRTVRAHVVRNEGDANRAKKQER